MAKTSPQSRQSQPPAFDAAGDAATGLLSVWLGSSGAEQTEAEPGEEAEAEPGEEAQAEPGLTADDLADEASPDDLPEAPRDEGAGDARQLWRRDKPLAPGLWLVSTPIGTARDITLRALDVLAAADVLAAEDTRSLRRLLEIHGIPLAGRHIVAYHDHSDARDREKLLRHLREGRSVAYASEAGTPLIADPGYQLVRACADEGIYVTAAPGVSAVITGLSLAGLPTDRFLFAGFAPSKSAERKRWLTEMANVPATLVIYESPRRVRDLLADALVCLGDRPAAMGRELTKKFEEIRRGTLSAIAAGLDADPRGEIVLVIDRGAGPGDRSAQMEDELRKALQTMRVRDAADAVAAALSLPRRDVYQLALRLAKEAD